MPRTNYHKSLFVAPIILVLLVILYLAPIMDGQPVLQPESFGMIPLIVGGIVGVFGTLQLGYLEWSVPKSNDTTEKVGSKPNAEDDEDQWIH